MYLHILDKFGKPAGIDTKNAVPAAIWFATEFRTPYEKLMPGRPSGTPSNFLGPRKN